jgi:hypothetical protein
MDKKPKKSAVAKVGRFSGSGRLIRGTEAAKPRSAQTIDRIAERHKRVLKRLADK